MRKYPVAILILLLPMPCVLTLAAQQRSAASEAVSLNVTYSYHQLGQLTGVDYGNGTRIAYRYDDAGNLVLTDMVTGDTRALSVNYTSGSRGSYITVRGSGFPTDSSILVLVNNFPMSPLVTSDASGAFVCVLDMGTASDGVYVVTAMVVPASGSGSQAETARAMCSATFMILAGSPQRAREGGTGAAPTLAVPAGSALPFTNIYVPLIRK